MKKRTRMIDELEKRLIRAYRAQESPAPGAPWQESVMSEIRRRGAFRAAANGQALFSRFAWRFSAAACLIALLLLAYIYSNGFVDYQELAMRYLENPMDFII